jgi:twinkle protein
MGVIERPAPNAATRASNGTTAASLSKSTARASAGTAGIATGPGANFTPEIRAKDVRGISPATLARMPVESGTAFFPEVGLESKALVFRYPTGWKARAIPDKAFVSSKGFKPSFWNLDAVLGSSSKTRVFITAGGLDALALVEAGISPEQVLSVPCGARERPADDPSEVRGYEYVKDALRAGLNACKEIVWCGDGDNPGRALRADMARIFGAAKFRFVDWPEGCKDANEFLIADGPDALRELAENGSLPWPVPGLYRLSELPEPPEMTLWNPGFPEWESKLKLAPGTMSVVTGHPGHGKSTLWTQIWFQIVKEYGLLAFVASFENHPKTHMRRQLRTLYAGKLEKDMSAADIAAADAWINERYLFGVHPDQKPNLDWFLDTAEVAVIRHGARIVHLDPWNRLEGGRPPNESETDYIGRCLRAVHGFAHDLNSHIQIIAHPAKMDSRRRGDPPSLEDISGSKHWENMVDQGFVVHRPEVFDGVNRKPEATLFHRKARFEELGYPCKLGLNYSLTRRVSLQPITIDVRSPATIIKERESAV